MCQPQKFNPDLLDSDEELIANYRTGDQQAFCELVRRYNEHLYKFLASGKKNSHDVEDLVQDTFFDTSRYILKHPNKTIAFKLLLFKIAANKKKRHWKKMYSQQHITMDLLPEISDGTQIHSTLAVKEALEALPEAERRVIVHLYFDGLTLKETGLRMGMAPSMIYRLKESAKEHLREILIKEE